MISSPSRSTPIPRCRDADRATLGRCAKLLAGVIALAGSSSRAADPAARPDPITVLCYNIHHANPPAAKDVIDIDGIAKVITPARPDLVALQELDVRNERSGMGLDQVKALAERTGLKAYFARGIEFRAGEYGVAILSRFPILESRRYPLTTVAGSGGEPRVLATVLLELPDKRRLLMACTHLDSQPTDSNRLVQVREVTGILSTQPHPVVVAGDFNAVPGSPVIDLLDRHFTRTGGERTPTVPADVPRRTIDFIAFTPGKFTIEKHEVIAECRASDHRPVIAVLRMN